jgi:hypothetical protein
MADLPSEPALDPRLRDYLAAELRQAETDFPHLPQPSARPARRPTPLATLLAAAALLLLVVVAGPRLLGSVPTGPGAVQLGADGLPVSIDGQPVLRGDDITRRATTAGTFLAGGTLALASDPCPMQAVPSAAPCIESWKLDGAAGTAPSFGLSGVPGAPGFVHTSGALTVVRVQAQTQPTTGSTMCPGCQGVLEVEAIAWRRPTKGPIPDGATPPDGGSLFEALVPDFVAAWNHDQTAIAGYIPREYLVGPGSPLVGSPSNPPQPPPDPVYGEDLTTLVGHMVAEVGFVPLGASPGPAGPSASVAPSDVVTTPRPGATPIPGLTTTPPPGLYTRFATASLSADGRTLTLNFVGGPEYAADDPCSIAYAGWAEAAGDVLYAAITDVTERTRPPGVETPQACDAVGHARTVSVALAAPFTGARLVDLAGYVHFLRAPDGLVELHGLPAGWTLRSASDVGESPTGRWLRVYAPIADPPRSTSKGHLDLYQASGGPVLVSGGDEVRAVTVNGQAATLYRSAPDGELVLVWTLGGDGLAITANETDFTADELVRLAEGATVP